MKKIVCLLVVYFFLLKLCSAATIINSKDWKLAYITFLFSSLKGEKDVYFVNSLGEAEILSMTLNKSEDHVIFEGKASSVVKNYEQFLKFRGFDHVSTTLLGSYWSANRLLFDKLKDELNCILVVNARFGYDLVSVFPLALKKKCWVLLYDPNDVLLHREVVKFLNENSKKRVIFYGEFLRRPWKSIKNEYDIIDEKSIAKNNLKAFKTVGKGRWAVLMSGEYLEPGSMMEGNPILLTLNDEDAIVKALKEAGINVLEVIGPENVDLGKRVRDKSNKTVGVVAKIGRTMVGERSLEGRMFYLNVLRLPMINEKLVVESVQYDRDSGKLVLLLKNVGNVELYFYVGGLGLTTVNGSEYLGSDGRLHLVYPNEYFSYTFETKPNLTVSLVDALVSYGFEFPLRNYIKNETNGLRLFPVKYSDLYDKTRVKLSDIFYDRNKEAFIIKVFNEGDVPAYVDAEIFDVNILGLNRTLSSSKRLMVGPGEEGEIEIYVYMDDGDLKVNRNLDVAIFFGDDEKMLVNSEYGMLRVRVVGIGITGYFVLILRYSWFLILILLLLLILLIWWKRRKSEEKESTD